MDIVKLLEKQAQQIANENHHGWGNTMLEAATEIERLRQQPHNNAIQNELLPPKVPHTRYGFEYQWQYDDKTFPQSS